MIDTFPDYGELYGYSPFREVQLFIDDTLAGVAWPFPIIFTGGVVPGLWRPIVGIDAFDLKEDEIDITPWLPLLCDGNAHNFTIKISGLNDTGNGTATLSEITDSYWLVTGKVFIWLDQAGHVTTGTTSSKAQPAPSLQVTSSVGTTNGSNSSLHYEVTAQRSLSFQSTINTSRGKKPASWRQSLSFTSKGDYTDYGNVEVNNQQTTGTDVSSSGYAKHFSYPIFANTTEIETSDTLTLFATVNRGKDVQTLGQPVFPTGLEAFAAANAIHSLLPSFQGASLSTTQDGTATYVANTTSNAAISFGTTEQDMTFSGLKSTGLGINAQGFPSVNAGSELFHRHATASNGTVIEDEETLVNARIGHHHGPAGNAASFALDATPGRGKQGVKGMQQQIPGR